jgi:hypothetical protein
MPETIDGTMTLEDQESAIQFKEAKGYELKSLKAAAGNPPTNEAEFKKLDDDLPDLFKLVQGAVPDDKEEVWSGTIYVEGKKQKAAGFREAE